MRVFAEGQSPEADVCEDNTVDAGEADAGEPDQNDVGHRPEFRLGAVAVGSGEDTAEPGGATCRMRGAPSKGALPPRRSFLGDPPQDASSPLSRISMNDQTFRMFGNAWAVNTLN